MIGLMIENMDELFHLDNIYTYNVFFPCIYYDKVIQSSSNNTTPMPIPPTSTVSSNFGLSSIGINSRFYRRRFSNYGYGFRYGYGYGFYLMGFKEIPSDKLLQNILLNSYNKQSRHQQHQQPYSYYQSQSLLSPSNSANNMNSVINNNMNNNNSNNMNEVDTLLLEPKSLHKYSHDLRELKFEFYDNENDNLIHKLTSDGNGNGSDGNSNSNNTIHSMNSNNLITNQLQSNNSNSNNNNNNSAIIIPNNQTNIMNPFNHNLTESMMFNYLSPQSIAGKKSMKKSFGASLLPEQLPLNTTTYGYKLHKTTTNN